jgi:hypothetical protein
LPRHTYLVVVLLAAACGQPPPSKEEVDDAKARVEAAMESADQVRTALELLGILPTYTCGEPRRTFVGQAVDKAQADYGCVTATTEVIGTTGDAVLLSYSGTECKVRDHVVSGSSSFNYNGGEDRLDLEADFRQTKVDGNALQAKAGYGTCADEKRYWGLAEGTLPKGRCPNARRSASRWTARSPPARGCR